MANTNPTALLVVDLQKGFMTNETSHIKPLIRDLIPEYDAVIATRFVNDPGSSFRRVLGYSAMGAGHPDGRLAIALPKGTLVLDKPGYGLSSLAQPLMRYLVDRHIKEVHICGVDTDACVTACALDLFSLGLRPAILAYACASTGGHIHHNAALNLLARNIGFSQIRERPAGCFVLENQDKTPVDIILDPLPKGRVKQNICTWPAIYVTFPGHAIRVPWNVVETGRVAPTLTLHKEDIYRIDDEGWNIMRTYGMYPTAFRDLKD